MNELKFKLSGADYERHKEDVKLICNFNSHLQPGDELNVDYKFDFPQPQQTTEKLRALCRLAKDGNIPMNLQLDMDVFCELAESVRLVQDLLRIDQDRNGTS